MSNPSCIETGKKKEASMLRKTYFARLFGRALIFICCVLLAVLRPEEFTILNGMNFFSKFSVLHLLWGLWVLDMLGQLFPIHKKISLGSLKLFAHHFQPIRDKISYEALRNYIVSTTRAAYRVMLLWIALIAAIGVLYCNGIIDKIVLFLISVCFYVCDLICVLIWCPFRLILKNRCCTTCRIFNWDHLMMFSPMLFLFGFYGWSLLGMAIIAWGVWELCVLLFPERFWEFSNEALQCAKCTDKLCTQYCQKLRN